MITFSELVVLDAVAIIIRLAEAVNSRYIESTRMVTLFDILLNSGAKANAKHLRTAQKIVIREIRHEHSRMQGFHQTLVRAAHERLNLE